MKSSSSVRGRITIIVGFMAVAGLLSALAPSGASAAEPQPPVLKEPIPGPTAQPSVAEREAWRGSMAQVPLPKQGQGCFKAEFPKTEWQEVPCTKAPVRPYPPARGPRPDTVGNGNDVSAQVTGHISKSIGSFDSVTGVTSESGYVGGNPPLVANTFSLQLNSNFFNTPSCNNVSGCQGWGQFVYSNAGYAFIQYWLIGIGTCPTTGGPAATGWLQYSNSCYGNSVSAAVPVQTIAALSQMTLTGTAASGGSDTIALSTGNQVYTASNPDSVVDLAQGWQISEFNIFGDCCGSQATFNSGSTLVVRTSVDYGSPQAPTCAAQGYTGETNNLSFGPAPSVSTVGSPAIVFTESTAGGASSTCASATSVGDTHLTTFDGLYYDFQASGDFVLAEDGSDFVVQTRQASGAPSWPNASLNKAVATQMGNTRVAIYVGPTRLLIDSQPYNLADGKSLLLASGVQVSRKGNVYDVTSKSGDSVRAVLNNNNTNTWIDVTVGLGRSPHAQARGLLGNPNGNAHELATATGTVLTAPVAFADLYHGYADSWRVQPNGSLFIADPAIEPGIPAKPFFASDLDPQEAERIRAICTAAGVTAQAHIDSCTLDTAVLGDEKAVQVFVHAVTPRAVLPRPHL